MTRKITMIYCPFPDKDAATHAAQNLIQQKLAACCQCHPVTSQFYWNNILENTEEVVLVVKTLKSKLKKAIKEIRKIHPYELPCIASWQIQINKPYYDWVKQTLSE